MDFTLKTYIHLLQTLKSHKYTFLPFSNYIQLYQQSSSPFSSSTCVMRSPLRRSKSEALAKEDRPLIILRHDVDKHPQNALRFAQIEHKLGVKGTYYFRAVPESWDVKVIKKIASLDHEIGYHYEDVDLAYKKLRAKSKEQSEAPRTQHPGPSTQNQNLYDLAIESFLENLEVLRKIVPVKTICMHGSPLSKFDNKLLWKYYDYKDFGIIGEPYFDVYFEDTLYLTDTGRRWDGNKFSVRDKPVISSYAKASEDEGWNGGSVSVRDKAESGRRKAEGRGQRVEYEKPYSDWKVKPKPGSLTNMTEKGAQFQSRYNFKSTNDIIWAAENGELPDKIMMTFHPQRWTDRMGPWVKELVWQNVKNVGKWGLVRIRQ